MSDLICFLLSTVFVLVGFVDVALCLALKKWGGEDE